MAHGVKRFYPEEKVIPVMVVLQPSGRLGDRDGAGIIFLIAVEELTVAGILGMHLADVVRHWISGGEHTRVPFLAPDQFPLIKQLAIVFSPDLKIVIVVRDDMAAYPVIPKQSRERVVKRLHRPSTALQKVKPSCH